MINDNRKAARAMVETLHRCSERAHLPETRALLRQAAVLLDEYQSGLSLATPHISTGYALVTTAQRALILDIETTAALEAAWATLRPP